MTHVSVEWAGDKRGRDAEGAAPVLWRLNFEEFTRRNRWGSQHAGIGHSSSARVSVK